MDAGLLKSLFGSASAWHGSCVVLIDAGTTVKTSGQDSIMSGGIKSYAPRVTSGRVMADAICYQAGQNALLIVQRAYVKQQTGEDLFQQTLFVADGGHVVGIEFEGLDILEHLGVPQPPKLERPHYTAGTLVG